MSDMNAIELANELTAPIGTSGQSTYAICEQAADMLRRQHGAIQKLREELGEIAKTSWVEACLDPQRPLLIAQQALKDTEGL